MKLLSLFKKSKKPITNTDAGFSSPAEYNNFKRKFLPYLLSLTLILGVSITVYSVQFQKDVRQQAQVIQSTPAQVNKFIFGICAHLTRRSVEPPPGKSVDLINRELDLTHNAGATMYREDFDWGTIEPQNNQFNFTTYDTTVNNAKARGLEPLGILDYRVGWTGGLNSDQFRTDFADYAYNTVLHFKDRVHYWEVWNEETGWWFWDTANHSTDPIAYGKLLIKAGQAIKRADPDAKVVFGGTHALQGLLDPNANSYVSKALAVTLDSVRAFDTVDIIAGHAYIDRFSGQTPENLYNLNVSQYYERYDSYLKSTYGAGKKYWHTETGWSTSTGGGYAVSEDMQANFIIRMYLIFLGGGKVDAFFAYDARNDGTNTADYEQNLGLVRHDFSPKPVYYAYQTMTKLLSNASFTEKLPWTDGTYGYVFTDSSKAQKIYALWAPTTDVTKTVSFGTSATAKKVLLTGAEETLPTQNGSLTLTLTKRPIYIILATGPTPTDNPNTPPTPTPTVTPPPTPTPGPLTTGYLSDQNWNYATNGDGPVLRDKANNGVTGGGTITLDTQTYTKGLGSHANADIRYILAGKCTNFSAKVGVDESAGTQGSVAFQVFADNIEIYNSGVVTGTTATKTINVDITNKQELKLIVTNGGDNWNFDRADWADAKVTCETVSTPTMTPTLTPTPTTSVINTVTSTPFYLRSDFGGVGGGPDGKIDIQDLNILAGEFYQTKTTYKADIIKTGDSLNRVDIQDYNAFVGDYQAYLAR